MLAHANGHREIFNAMAGRRSGAAIQRLLHKMVVDLVRQDVTAVFPPSSGRSTHAEPLIQFLAGAYYGLLMWWLDARMRISVQEVDALFRRLALPALNAALGPA
jgi:hypothetical protein